MRLDPALRSFRRRRTVVSGLVVAGLLAVPAAVALPTTVHAQSIEDKRVEAARVADEFAELDRQLMDLNAEAEAARYGLSQAEAEVTEAQERVDRTDAELEVKRAEMRSFAVDAYKSGDDSPALNALLTADPDTAPTKKSYIEVATGNRRDLVDALAGVQRKAEDETARLQQAQAEANRHTSEIDRMRDGVAEATEAQRALNERVQGELADLVREEQDRRAEEARRAAEAASERERLREAPLADRQATAAPEPSVTADGGGGSTAGGGGSTSGGGGRAATPAPALTPAPPPRTPPPAPNPAPAPPPPAPTGPPPAPVGSGADAAINAALSQVGRSSYVWGAASPPNFDCSGLTSWAYRQAGISLPHYSGAQWNVTTRISRSQLQRGDLVFWGAGGSEHVAIYMGGNQLVHSFPSGGGVKVTALDGWWRPPTGYGRLR